MNVLTNITNKFKGLSEAVIRYPLTLFFLTAAAIVNMLSIMEASADYSRMFVTFLVGALLSAVGQQLYERFFTGFIERIALWIAAILLALGYYYVVFPESGIDTESGIRTTVIIFALSVAFIWIPSMNQKVDDNKIDFNESFLATFKAFFTTLLFTMVVAGGISAIIFAVDRLLFSVDSQAMPHMMNVIFVLFAPVFFLSLIPPYFGKESVDQTKREHNEQEEQIAKAISCPKNLEWLISYIVIPLTAIYTIILLAYVLLNFSGDFWTDNLLEPMLVSYAVTGIVVYILASNLENKFVRLFRKIFPFILIPIVLFQTVASVLKINEVGITYGRYYVILFGVYATISGLIFILRPIRKNGIIAAVLLVFAFISITPPVDAFSVSRSNQLSQLRSTLEENNMIQDGSIIPNSDIPAEDRRTITRTVNYLNEMGYEDEVSWLPDNLFYAENFRQTFGFEQEYGEDGYEASPGQYAYLEWDNSQTLNIEEYDRMIHLQLSSPDREVMGADPISFEVEGTVYSLVQEREGENVVLQLVNANEEELIQVDVQSLLDGVFQNTEGNSLDTNLMTVEQATIVQENDQAKISFLVHSADRYDTQYSIEGDVFIQIK